jgi:hypothetical protein
MRRRRHHGTDVVEQIRDGKKGCQNEYGFKSEGIPVEKERPNNQSVKNDDDQEKNGQKGMKKRDLLFMSFRLPVSIPPVPDFPLA